MRGTACLPKRGTVTRTHTISVFIAGLIIAAVPAMAQLKLGPVTVGAGMRTSFVHTQPDTGDSSDKFNLDSIRLYVGGPVTEDGKIKFMFNTDYNSITNHIGVLDAVGRFELAPAFNVWAGRVLPPSDRSNLAGPYYNNHWGVYTDGIQNGHPSVFQGRDNGFVYWGDFTKNIKVSAGAFDGQSADGRTGVISAFRVQLDFWDHEDGYYLNSTYYGAKKLLALGGATQVQSGKTATTVDFLLERKLGTAGVITLEGEYANYNGLGGYDPRYVKSQGAYGLVAYIFPKAAGPGKVQLLGKYAKADFTHGSAASYNQKTAEGNINYLIKEFNARVMTFVRNTSFSRGRPDSWSAGIGIQLQM